MRPSESASMISTTIMDALNPAAIFASEQLWVIIKADPVSVSPDDPRKILQGLYLMSERSAFAIYTPEEIIKAKHSGNILLSVATDLSNCRYAVGTIDFTHENPAEPYQIVRQAIKKFSSATCRSSALLQDSACLLTIHERAIIIFCFHQAVELSLQGDLCVIAAQHTRTDADYEINLRLHRYARSRPFYTLAKRQTKD